MRFLRYWAFIITAIIFLIFSIQLDLSNITTGVVCFALYFAMDIIGAKMDKKAREREE